MLNLTTRYLNDDAIATLVRSMAEIAQFQTTQQREAFTHASRKADGSEVSDVDTQSQQMLGDTLRAISPYPIVGEEHALTENLNALAADTPVWVVDPLDGTASYLRGFDEYAINVGLLSAPDAQGNRTPVFGAVMFPAKGQVFFTNARGEAKHALLRPKPNEELFVHPPTPLRCKPFHLHRGVLKIATGFRESDDEEKGAAFFGAAFDASHAARPVKYEGEAPAKITCMSHTGAYRTAQMLRHERDIALFARPSMIWDTAALDAIVRAAGGVVAPIDVGTKSIIGSSLYYGNDPARYLDGHVLANSPYMAAHKKLPREIGLQGAQHIDLSGLTR